jgi:hypothetical protein
MATHRRETRPQLTPLTLLGMTGSVLLILIGIAAAARSPHPESTGPLFQPLGITGSAPPGPLILLDEHTAPSATTPAPAPVPPKVVPATAPQKKVSRPVQVKTVSEKISARSETPSVSIQKMQDDQQTFRPPTPDGRCSGTGSECLDNIQSAPLTKAPDIGRLLSGPFKGLWCVIGIDPDCA